MAGRTDLGPLERAVLEALWNGGEGNVRDVNERLGCRLAYTTVMTTLDRLFKKRVLDRRKLEKAFVYVPVESREDWEKRRAAEIAVGIVSAPRSSRNLLISCLVDAAGEADEAILDELERRIREKRLALAKEQGL
jgi:predicted transcriptional regulator